MFGAILSPVIRWIAGIFLVLSVIFGIYYKGRLDERKLFNAYKAEVSAIAKAQAEQTKKTEEKNQRLLKETQNAYNTRLANLRAYYGVRNSNGAGLVPKVPGAATGANGFSIDNLPAPIVLAGQCAETTLTLVSLQEWVKNVAYNME